MQGECSSDESERFFHDPANLYRASE